MASIMSSTVTMPITCPTASTTGSASRSYFEISRAASSRLAVGETARGDAEHVVVGVARDQTAQGHRLGERPGARVEHEDRVDGLAGLLDVADVLQGLAHRPGARHGDELGCHQRADRLLAVGREAVDGAAGLGIEAGAQVGPAGLLDLPEHVRDPVGRHAGQVAGHPVARQHLDDVGGAVELRLVEHLDRPLHRQAEDDRGGDLGGLLVQGLDDVGRALVRQACGQHGRVDTRVDGGDLVHGLASRVTRRRAAGLLALRAATGEPRRSPRGRASQRLRRDDGASPGTAGTIGLARRFAGRC
jgi:hypothetical protein